MNKPLDEKELAEFLGVSYEWVRLRVKRSEIPFTRLPGGERGKLVRFTAEHVAAILAAGEQPALNGPLAERRLALVDRTHPPSGPQTPTPPPGPRKRAA